MHRAREYAKNYQQTIFIYQFFLMENQLLGFFSLVANIALIVCGESSYGAASFHTEVGRADGRTCYYNYNAVLQIGEKNHPPKTSQLHLCGCCNLIFFFGSYLYFSLASDLFPCIHWVLHLWLRQTEKLLLKLGVGWGGVKV